MAEVQILQEQKSAVCSRWLFTERHRLTLSGAPNEVVHAHGGRVTIKQAFPEP
jgi:hypothetical protein